MHHGGGCGGGHDGCEENPSQGPWACHPSPQHSQTRALAGSPRHPGVSVGWLGRLCLRRGRRHILYKQQQEQVKQMMMVATKSTKMVRPMATVAPNPMLASTFTQGPASPDFPLSIMNHCFNLLPFLRKGKQISSALPSPDVSGRKDRHQTFLKTQCRAAPTASPAGRGQEQGGKVGAQAPSHSGLPRPGLSWWSPTPLP